jgi:hypothetical protein
VATNGAELQEKALEVHQRLLGGDPVAPADAAELLLDQVAGRLRYKWPDVVYTDACSDAAVEVLVTYLADPSRYQPSRSSLVGWLVMQAHRDLINDYDSKPKRFERLWLVESALPVDPNTGETPRLDEQVASFDTVPVIDGSSVLAAVREAFPDERDRRLIWLMCIEENHSTEAAAEVLEITDLPSAQQTAEVKRRKDRIMRHLRRLGLDKRDE